MKWKIKDIEIANQVVLAPMAGISNPAYFKICEEMKVGYLVTELISAEAIVRNNKKTFDMLKGLEDVKVPYAIQLFGSNIESMVSAAKIINKLYKTAVIDINMGCPVPKVALRSGAGSALLKDSSKVYHLVKRIVDAVDTPVTVKIRSGWDHNSINACEIAKKAEEAGASAIFIHARTRSQGYSGKADWSVIKEVVDSVSIPVIGNGDIKSYELAKKMLDETGCAAIMIGRSALGNPWLIENTVKYLEGDTNLITPTEVDKINMCIKHLKLLGTYKQEKTAALEIRNHIAWYLKGVEGSQDIKKKVYQITNLYDILQVLEEFRRNFE